MNPQSPLPPTTRDVLLEKLAVLRGSLRFTMALAGLAVPMLVLVAWVAVSVLLDVAFEPARAVRVLLLLAGVGGVCGAVFWYVIRPAIWPLSDDDLAVIVERRWPDLENRVISAVQFGRLSEAQRASLNFSPSMIAQVRADAVGQTQYLDFGDAVNRARALLGPTAWIGTGILLTGAAMAAPDFAALWARRALLLENVARPRAVQFVLTDPAPDRPVVRRIGDNLALTVELTPGSQVPELLEVMGTGGPDDATGSGSGWFGERPRLLLALEPVDAGRTGKPTASATAGASGAVYRGLLRNLRRDAALTIRGGDGELGPLTVRVVEAVDCKSMTLDGVPPAYISSTVIRQVWGQPLSVPEGTEITITGTASKPLSGVELRLPAEIAAAVEFHVPAVVEGLFTPEQTAAMAEALGTETLAVRLVPREGADPTLREIRLPSWAVEGSTFRLGISATRSVAAELILTDADGLTNFHSGEAGARPIRLEIEVRPDQPPVARLKLNSISELITPAARLPASIVLRDDHGLRSARLAAFRPPDGETLARDPKAGPVELSPAVSLAAGAGQKFGPGVRELAIEAALEVGDLGLKPGDRIEIDVPTEDFRPLSGAALGALGASGSSGTVSGKPRFQQGGVEERNRRTLQVVTAETLLAELLKRLNAMRDELKARRDRQFDLWNRLNTAESLDKDDMLADAAYESVRTVALEQQKLHDDLSRLFRQLNELIAEMDNNRVWTEGDDRRQRLVDLAEEGRVLLDKRLSRLFGPTGPESLSALLPNGRVFALGLDANGDGLITSAEWQELLEPLMLRIDPDREFLDAGPASPSQMFRTAAGPRGVITEAELVRTLTTREVRRLYWKSAMAVQEDARARMDRMLRLLPQSKRFGEVIQSVRVLIDRQRDALKVTQKASDSAAEDLFDEPKK